MEIAMAKPRLTVEKLITEASAFAVSESSHHEPELYGVTDGKAVGTYLEHKFQSVLRALYTYEEGSSARGIDFPTLNVDMKATNIRQPQSSCPFKSAQQKIRGLGYSLLVFVYDKSDDHRTRTTNLHILHTIYVDALCTADYQTTRGILEILERDGNVDDLVAFLSDRNLPIDEISANRLAEDILKNPPRLGYLTISNALQWRLQYKRVIELAGTVDGIIKVG